MKNRALVLGAIGIALGAFGYVRLTRFDRIATSATTHHMSGEDWELLRDRPDDERVAVAARMELRRAAGIRGCEGIVSMPSGARAVLDTHPTSDDDSLAAVAVLVATCPDARTMLWTKRSAEDLVHALHADLAHAAGYPKDVLADALVRLGPRTNQELVDLVVSAVKSDASTADALVTTGLPEDGEKLADATANTLRQATQTDPRVTTAIRTWLGSMNDDGASDAAASALLRVLPWAQAPAVDDAMADAIAKAIDATASVEKLCAALVALPADAQTLRKHGTGEKIDACARTAADMQPALEMLNNATAPAEFDDLKAEDANKKRSAWEDAQADAVAKLGPPALAAAREGLKSNARTTQRVSARAFAKLDAAGYAATMAERLRAHAADADDARLALELLPPRTPLQAQAALAAYFTGDADAMKRATAALKVTDAALWVPPLFASITVVTASQPPVVSGYGRVLELTNGVGPFAARALDAAMTRAGRPDAVFWLTKVLALRALKAHGTAGDARIVERLTSDKSAYPQFKMRTEQFSGEVVEESRESKTISELATATLAQLKGR